MAKYNESYEEKIARRAAKKRKIIDAAMHRIPADTVLKNAVYFNVFNKELCRGDIAITEDLIVGTDSGYHGINEYDVSGKVVVPGFIDSHIHLESTMLSPVEFAKYAIRHGTTTIVADPHEIANVLGIDGIRYMIEATEGLPLDVYFTLPSCVPATKEDENGAILEFKDIDSFYNHPRVLSLAEMMNYVGVINNEESSIDKIIASHAHHKRIDGHAPGLHGCELNAYIASGIYSDHECTTYAEAYEKLSKGQYIMIREGTSAKNLEALAPILTHTFSSRAMFVTDDIHANDLIDDGHIDAIVRKAIGFGITPFVALQAASYNPAVYYSLNHKGAIAPGYLGDLAVIDNVYDINVEKLFKRGRAIYDLGDIPFTPPAISTELLEKANDSFRLKAPVEPSDFAVSSSLGLIGLVKGQIVTENLGYCERVDTENDILKAAVVERHKATGHIGLGFIKGYGLKRGAVALSISHDSHNIVVVGENDSDMAKACNRVAELHGGIVLCLGGEILCELPLPIAGLMSVLSAPDTADILTRLKKTAFSLGVSSGIDPFMSLSFISLPVIPEIRLMTRGIFNVITGKYE